MAGCAATVVIIWPSPRCKDNCHRKIGLLSLVYLRGVVQLMTVRELQNFELQCCGVYFVNYVLGLCSRKTSSKINYDNCRLYAETLKKHRETQL